MGFLRRLFGSTDTASSGATAREPHILADGFDLEVVGESRHQDELWRIVGQDSNSGQRVRCPVVAVLRPEPSNPVDANAIAVDIGGLHVGYLPADDAATMVEGLRDLRRRHGRDVALRGVVVGRGGGSLGVFLGFDPADFGVPREWYDHAPPGGRTGPAPARVGDVLVGLRGSIRTGLSEAVGTDEEDDSYDLGWLGTLPDRDDHAVAALRSLLASDPDPIDRHFQYCELEHRLYRLRGLNAMVLADFDAACRSHDAEMDVIRAALVRKFGVVPVLETYRQAAIRHQKAGDWAQALWWAERGLVLYGDIPARPEAVADLRGRADTARKRLHPPSRPREPRGRVVLARDESAPAHPSPYEDLLCAGCGQTFTRVRTRGRKPSTCPGCAQGR